MGHGSDITPEERLEREIENRKEWIKRAKEVEEQLEAAKRPAAPMIHAKLIEVMREVTSVAKTGMNTQQNYPFRGIDGVMNEVGPAMRKVGVLAIPTVLKYQNRDTLTTGDKKTREVVMEVRYDFYAEDGSSVSAIVWGESLDFSDKGTAKALSVALRQALLQTLMLPTQEPTTDDNGHYHTRAGTGTLSGWTATHGKKILTEGTLAEVIDFWPAIVESSSIEAPHQAGTGWLTWGELAAKRVATLVDAEQSPETLRTWWGQLRAADMIGLFHADESGRYQLGDLVVEKGKQAKLNRDKAFDHCMQLITSAATPEELDNARVHVRADSASQGDGLLTAEQLSELLAVARERHDKLVSQLATPLPPIGYAWDQFVQFADRQNLTGSDIEDMLNGQWDKDAEAPAAHEYGVNGLIRLADAVKRSNVRDHTIDNVTRANLIQLIREKAHENGIAISDANL